MALIIRVAADLCCGHHRCTEVAPDVFTLEQGLNSSDGQRVPEGLEAKARLGASLCPESAIDFDDGD
ncbi:MAG: ferredoxin [Acidimicrobiia bacterium]